MDNYTAKLQSLIKLQKLHLDLLELLKTLNPEDYVPNITLPQEPYRLLTWYGQTENIPSGPFYERTPFPYKTNILDLLTKTIPQITKEKGFEYFYVREIRWCYPLQTVRNRFVPHYAPKSLSKAVVSRLTQIGTDGFAINPEYLFSRPEKVICSFENISPTDWYLYQQNPIQVIPLNIVNLNRVMAFLFDQALEELK